MKKKILTCLLMTAIALMLFVSCNGEQALPDESDGLAYVEFGENLARSFTSTYTPKDYDTLYWFYTATKDDTYGTYGQTTAETRVNEYGTGLTITDSSGSTKYLGPFSQGKWTFNLSAYDNADKTTLIYKSDDISVILLGGETKTISASVTPQGENGTVILDGAYFKYASVQNSNGTAPVFTIKITNRTTNASTEYTSEGNTLTLTKDNSTAAPKDYTQYSVKFASEVSLAKGTYQCDVAAYIKTKDTNEDGTEKDTYTTQTSTPLNTNTFYFAVYPNAETKILGDLTEDVTSKVTINDNSSAYSAAGRVDAFNVPKIVIETKPVEENKVTFENSTTSTADNDKLLSETKVALDLSGLNTSTEENKIQSVTLETETRIGEKAAEGFSVVDKSNAAESVLVSLDFTAKDQNGEVIGTKGFGKCGESDVAQTITKFVGKDKNNGKCYNCNDSHTDSTKYTSSNTTNNLAVYYNGVEDTEKYKITKYNAETGYAEFTTIHFSTFVLVDKTNFPAYIETNSVKKYYPTLEEAFAAAEETIEKTENGISAVTIVVNKSTYIQKDITVSQSGITLDLNGNSVKGRNNASIIIESEKTLIVSDSGASTNGSIDVIKGVKVNSDAKAAGTYYPDVAAAFTAANAIAEGNSVVTLLNDASIVAKSATNAVSVSRDITLDLGGKVLNSTNRAFVVHKGTLTIKNGTLITTITEKDGGKIDSGSSAIKVDCSTGSAGLTLEKTATIRALNCYGITAFNNSITDGSHSTATLVISGTIESANPCVAGNGANDSKADVTDITVNITINEGAVLTQDSSSLSADTYSVNDAAAVYKPNCSGTLTINGGAITSKNGSAVEIRAGKAEIKGGTITSNAGSYSYKANGSGTTVTGAAVAVSQHSTKKDIDVTISGGTFSGAKKLAVVNTLSTKDDVGSTDKVKVTVTSGANIDDADIDGIKVYNTANTSPVYYPTLEAAVDNAEQNQTIKLLSNLDLTYYKTKKKKCLQIAKGVVIDLNNKKLTTKNYCVIWQGESFTIQNGTLEAVNGGSYSLIVYGAPLNNGDAYESNHVDWVATIKNVTCLGGINVNCHKAVIEDSTVGGTGYYSIFSQNSGEITIKGKSFESENNVLNTGLSDYGDDNKNSCKGNVNDSVKGTIIIEDGSFKNGEKVFYVTKKDGVEYKPLVTVKGGTFSEDPSPYFPTNDASYTYSAEKNSDGLWVVTATAK